MPTITISLPESLKKFIEEQVHQEGFGTVSEYLRALVRYDQKRKAQSRLEELLLEGLQTNPSQMTDQDWAHIRQQIRQRIKKNQSTSE